MNEFWTVEQLAAHLQVSRWWIQRKCKCGILPHIRIGRTVRFNWPDIQKWISAHSEKGALKV